VVRRADGKPAVLFDNRDRQTAPRPSASRDREPRASTVNRASGRGYAGGPVAAGSGRKRTPPDPKRTDFMYEKPCRRSQSASGKHLPNIGKPVPPIKSDHCRRVCAGWPWIGGNRTVGARLAVAHG
jgi:hypothetical protein